MAKSDRDQLLKGLDFQGQQIHFVQIGLGTNSTFIQNCAGKKDEWDPCIEWLLQATSDTTPHDKLRGIAVEPVAELAASLHCAAERLQNVELVQVAIGETDKQNAEMHAFSIHECDALLQQVPAWQQSSLQHDLEYILNMSSVGAISQEMQWKVGDITRKYNVLVDVKPRYLDVWTWGHLSNVSNFHGCEVLLIDTEGYDTQILRSLIQYCHSRPSEWPQLIQFETMGHCDELEGTGSEWATVEALEVEGYTLVNFGHHNTYLVLAQALKKEHRLQKWLWTWRCTHCRASWEEDDWQHVLPFTTDRTGTYCQRCRCHWLQWGVGK